LVLPENFVKGLLRRFDADPLNLELNQPVKFSALWRQPVAQ
jgi:hypothetical protein